MEFKKPLTWPRAGRCATRPGAGVASLEETKPEGISNIQVNLSGCRGRDLLMPVRGLDTLTNNGPAHVLVWVMKLISYARHRFPSDIIRHAVWLYLRFTLSYRDVEDLLALLAERGLMVSNEFDPSVGAQIRTNHC